MSPMFQNRVFTDRLNYLVNIVDSKLTCRQLLDRIKEKVLKVIQHENTFYDGPIAKEWSSIGIWDYELHQEFLPSPPNKLCLKITADGLSMAYSDQYDRRFVQQLLDHVTTVSEKLLDHLDLTIGELSIVSAEEQHALIHKVGRNNEALPIDGNVIQLFKKQVAKDPKKVAVVYKERYITYHELDEKSDQIALTLKIRGVTINDRVIVLMERSDRLLTIILGVWKLGAVYIPIDPVVPASRIAEILKDATPKCIFSQHKFGLVLPQESLNITLFFENFYLQPKEIMDYDQVCQPSDLAYIIYTSGTTGSPKGVKVEHAGMLNHLVAKINDFHINDKSKIAETASQSFDISIWQFAVGLLAGGTVHVYDDATVTNISMLLEQVEKDNISILELVPSYLTTLFELVPTEMIVKSFHDVKHLLLTGEELKLVPAARCLELLSETDIYNVYGPTEASDDVTHFKLSEPFPLDVLPVGRPLPNVQIYVVNSEGRLCPLGVKGEIWVSGLCVGPGYWKRQELTRQAFIGDPYRTDCQRVFKTGDIGAWTMDGDLLCFGRKDTMVKVKGCRIELRDIEFHLTQLEGIRDAVVLAPQDQGGELYLHAFLICPAGIYEQQRIRDFLQKRLPVYMIPQRFDFLSSFPTLPSGKIDRKKLIQGVTTSNGMMEEQPQCEQERNLLRIWQEVLKDQSLMVHSNFFECGGNSLGALRVVTSINRLYNTNVTIQDLFDYPTVRLFSGQLLTGQKAVPPVSQERQGHTIEL